ncbi:MAG: MMPL family transporter [Bacteroidota bacterium]|nr:MMPL family transporter [Bacteroidota bacterium]
MWTKIAHVILKNRFLLILIIGIITVFMALQINKLEMSYDFAKVVPSHDPEMMFFEEFKGIFGEDGNIMVLGTLDSSLFEPQNFSRFKYLNDEIARLHGINNVLSLPLLQRLEKDIVNKKFVLHPVFNDLPDDQVTLDSLLLQAQNLKFYNGQVYNEKNGATLMLVSIQKEVLNSKSRQKLVDDILAAGEAFTESTGIQLHYSGLPYVRSILMSKVKDELNLFLGMSLLVTALILFFFFRSLQAVIFPILVIGVMVIWAMGTLSLFNYKITILSGLIAPIIVVIGIPNCIYLLNKYHQEYGKHGNQIKALSRIIRKIGLVTLITNFTTAIGFIVLAFTDIIILKEFGIVAGINIFATFFVSIILIPAIFSYLPPPGKNQLKHLNFKMQETALSSLDILVHRHKESIFLAFGIITLISIVGIYKIESVSFMVDDIPDGSQIKQDLRFFERNFNGVMPLEVIVDTNKKRGVMKSENLQKVHELEGFLSSQNDISKPISLVGFVKASRQAFYNNNPDYYGLPNNQDRNFIFAYYKGQSDQSGLFNSFVDSTGQKMRVSFKVADIGSNKLDSLVHEVLEPGINRIFGKTDMDVKVTGTTLLFVKGNKFLIENLRMSLVLAFGLIALVMAFLFQNVKMIILSLIPNIIPLLITGGIMGYFGIALKPSTALIFSIAFGISVDDSIHFLAKYRQELFSNRFFVPVAVSNSLREIGPSMIYTSIVLFAGFVIFAGSEFGGTVALGVLTSTTLLFAMMTNLILLPSLLLTFDDGRRNKHEHPLIEHYDEFYQEDEDEDIDIDLLQLENLAVEEGKD